MRNSNSPPSYQGGTQPPQGAPSKMQGPAPAPQGAAMMPNTNAPPPPRPPMQPPQQQGMAGLGQGMRAMYDRMRPPPGPPPGGPPSTAAPISPEGYGAYQKLGEMPITGGGSRRQYNQAAQQFAQQYGSGFDPKGMLARTKALRKQYGGQK